jgi:hypothetical protein
MDHHWNAKRSVFRIFFGIFKELFKDWPKFWDVTRLNGAYLQ